MSNVALKLTGGRAGFRPLAASGARPHRRAQLSWGLDSDPPTALVPPPS